MSDTDKVTIPARHIVNTIRWVFAEANSFALILNSFEAEPNVLRKRNEIRKYAFRLRNDIDALQQALEELQHGLTDFELEHDLLWSDHGQALKGDF